MATHHQGHMSSPVAQYPVMVRACDPGEVLWVLAHCIASAEPPQPPPKHKANQKCLKDLGPAHTSQRWNHTGKWN